MVTDKENPAQQSDLQVVLNRIEGELARGRVFERQIVWLVPLQVGCSFIIAGGAAWWHSLWTLAAVVLGFILMGYSWWRITRLRRGQTPRPN
jgi:Flp pilus assembly protein TadB